MRFISKLFFALIVTSSFPGLASPDLPNSLSGNDLASGRPVAINFSQAKIATAVIFLSSKCPCSANHEPILSELSKQFGRDGFQFVGVNSNSDERVENATKHFADANLAFPVIRDEGSKIADQFKALKTPHAFVINPRGEILFQGGVDDSANPAKAKSHFLKEALLAIKSGKEPAAKVARALGCSISRP